MKLAPDAPAAFALVLPGCRALDGCDSLFALETRIRAEVEGRPVEIKPVVASIAGRPAQRALRILARDPDPTKDRYLAAFAPGYEIVLEQRLADLVRGRAAA